MKPMKPMKRVHHLWLKKPYLDLTQDPEARALALWQGPLRNGVVHPLTAEEKYALLQYDHLDPKHIRGPRRLPEQLVRMLVEHEARIFGHELVDIGVMPPMKRVAFRHGTLLLGDSGRAKTLLLKVFLGRLVLPEVRAGRARLWLFDDNNQLGPWVSALSPPHIPFRQICPLLEEASALDIPASFPGLAGAEMFAWILVPKSTSHDRYFDDGARFGASMGMDTLGLAVSNVEPTPGRPPFDLADYVSFCLEEDLWREGVEKNPYVRGIYRQIFQKARSAGDVHSTFATHLARFRLVAAAMRRCKEHFSTGEIAEEAGVTVFGGDFEHGEALADYYRLVITSALAKLMTRQYASEDQIETWIVADEFHSLHELPALVKAIAQGRGAKVNLLLASTSREVIEYHMNRAAAAVTTNPQNLICYGTSSPETAQFMSARFSSEEFWDVSYNESVTYGDHGNSVNFGKSASRKERPIFSAGEFIDEQAPNPERGRFSFAARSPWWPAACRCEQDLLAAVKEIEASGDFTPAEPPKRLDKLDELRLPPFTRRRGREVGMWKK